MYRVILFLLFYFLLIVISSATYDINDMTGNYPYCLTASKDNKSPTSHEKSEILKKSFPFTYLEIMGNTPHDSIHVGNEVKANQWSARNDPEIGLVEKDNELASDNDYSNTIGYNSLEMTNNWNKDLVQNNFVTNSPLKAIKNDMEVSHNFPANNDFEPTNNIAMRHLRTNNQLNNMERTNDLEMVNKIGTDNKQMFDIEIQTHDNHPSIQYGEDSTESSGHTRNDMNGINRKSVRRNTNMVQAHHKMIDNMPNVNIHNYNAPSNSLTRPGENMQSDIRTDNAKSDNVLDNVRGKNIQSEKMLRDANIPNVYYQTHTVRSGNIESDNGQNGNVQNGNIHINNIHSNDIRSDNMLNDNVDENMQDNVSSHSMLNDIIDIQTNMLSPSGDLLVSNDVAQVLQGKTNSLTDEFIGVDERLVNNESNEKHYAKHNGGNIGKEKGTLKGFANGKKKADKNLLKKTVVDEVEKKVCEKELNKKENARVKDVRKLIDGTEHKKITGNGKAKKVKLLKHLSPPIAGSKLRRQGKSKSLQVDNLNAAAYNNMTRNDGSEVDNLIFQHPGDSTKLKSDSTKALSAEFLKELRANPKKRSAENLSDVGDKIYQIYQDMTELNNRVKLNENSRNIVDHNVCVDDQNGTSKLSITTDTRRKRMLLGRKKKRKKHSKTQNEIDSHLEKSESKEDKKKQRKSTKKRKFLRRKHRLGVNPKTMKDSNLNLVNANYNSARYRRGAKSSSLFDMFSLPFDKYLQDPDQNKKDRGVKKTLKINKERRADFPPNDIEGSSDLFNTIKPDLQDSKNPIQSDVLGFMNGQNTNKKNSKKKQVVSLNTNRINQKTNYVSNDLLAASNFMNMFSGNMNLTALRSFLSNIDNTTHATTVHSVHSDVAPKVKPKEHNSLVHCNRDGGFVPVLKLDPIYDLPNALKNMYMTSNMSTTSKEDILLGWNLPKLITKLNYQCEPDPCASMILTNKPITTFATFATPVHFVTSAKPPLSTVQNIILTTNLVVTNTKPSHDEHHHHHKVTVGNKETTPQQTTTPNPNILCGSQQGETTPTSCKSPENSSGNTYNNKIETTCSIATQSTATWVTGPTTPSPTKPSNDLCTTTLGDECATTPCPTKPSNDLCTTTLVDECATTPSPTKPSNDLCTTTLVESAMKTTASAGQNYSRITTANMSDNCITTMPSFHNDISATNSKDTKNTSCITQFSLQNERLTNNKLNGNLNKVKRQALPLNLFPMLLQKDIEQPVQEGQSKKILLYLYQGNPNEMSVNAKEEGSELQRFAHPHLDLTRDSNLVKKFFSPTFDIRFSSKSSASTEKCDSEESSKKSSTTTTCKNPKHISIISKPSTTTCKTITTTGKRTTASKTSTAAKTTTPCKTSKPSDNSPTERYSRKSSSTSRTTKKSLLPVKSTTSLSNKNLSLTRRLSMNAPMGTTSPTKACNSFLHNSLFSSKNNNATKLISKSQKSTTTQSITIECPTTPRRTTTSTTSSRPSTKLTTHPSTTKSSTHHSSTICETIKTTAHTTRSTTHATSHPTTRTTAKSLSTEKTTVVTTSAPPKHTSVVTTCITSPTTTCATTTKVTSRPTTTHTTTKPTTTRTTTKPTTTRTTTKPTTTCTTTKPTTTPTTTKPTTTHTTTKPTTTHTTTKPTTTHTTTKPATTKPTTTKATSPTSCATSTTCQTTSFLSTVTTTTQCATTIGTESHFDESNKEDDTSLVNGSKLIEYWKEVL